MTGTATGTATVTGAPDRLVRAGTAHDGDFALVVTPESAGWGFSGLRVAELGAGATVAFSTGEYEVLVLPLSGGCAVEVDGERFELAGREDVFSGVTYFAYAPRDAQVRLTSAQGGRVALPAARVPAKGAAARVG